jgi:hypothetical protein
MRVIDYLNFAVVITHTDLPPSGRASISQTLSYGPKIQSALMAARDM